MSEKVPEEWRKFYNEELGNSFHKVLIPLSNQGELSGAGPLLEEKYET
jgi:hypothetical protein